MNRSQIEKAANIIGRHIHIIPGDCRDAWTILREELARPESKDGLAALNAALARAESAEAVLARMGKTALDNARTAATWNNGVPGTEQLSAKQQAKIDKLATDCGMIDAKKTTKRGRKAKAVCGALGVPPVKVLSQTS